MNELVTIEEFRNQIYITEGINVEINLAIDRLVRPYDYPRLSDNATVNELNDRIYECIRPFIYFITL